MLKSLKQAGFPVVIEQASLDSLQQQTATAIRAGLEAALDGFVEKLAGAQNDRELSIDEGSMRALREELAAAIGKIETEVQMPDRPSVSYRVTIDEVDREGNIVEATIEPKV
jgi:hypothetical protein